MAVRFDADAEDFTRALAAGSLTAFSVACWVNIRVDRNTYSTVWSLDSGAITDAVHLQSGVDGLIMQVNTDNDAALISPGPTLTVGTWWFIGFSYSSSGTCTLTSRAATATSFTTSTAPTGSTAVNAANLRIGESVNGGEWLNGSIAAFKLWTGVTMSAAELQNEAFAYQPTRLLNLRAWYPFLAKETVDYSGNGNTLSGGAAAATDSDGPPIGWAHRRPETVISSAAVATLFSQDFQGGAHGATLTTGNTNFAAILGSPTFDNTTAARGTQSVKFPGGSTMSVEEQFTATTSRYFRRYFRMEANPSATTVIASARSGTGTTRAQIRVTTTGQLQLRNALIADGADSTTVLSPNTWYRLEWDVVGGSSQQILRIYSGANLHGPTVTETMTRTFTSATFDNIIDGQITSATWVTYEDGFYSSPHGATPIPVFQQRFEGTDEVDVLPANSGGTSGDALELVQWDTGNAVKYDNATAAHGSTAARYTTGATGGIAYTQYGPTTFGTRTEWATRFFMRYTTSHNGSILSAMSGTSNQYLRLQLATNGALRVHNAALTTLATSTTLMSALTWYRIEGKFVMSATAGTYEVKIFAGDSTTALETLSGSSANFGGAIDRIRVGYPGGGTNLAALWFDAWAISDGGYELWEQWANPTAIASAEAFPAPASSTIAFTNRAGAYSAPDATSFVTASFTPTAKSVLVAYVQTSHATAAPTPTLTSTHATWTQQSTLVTPNDGSTHRRLTVYTGVVNDAPAAGTVTISCGGTTATGCAWGIVEATNVDTTSPIVQIVPGTTTGDPLSQTITLAAASATANRVIAGFTNPWQNTATPEAGWTEAYDVFGVTPATDLTVVHNATAFDTTASVTWVSNGDSGGIALELRAQTASAGHSVTVGSAVVTQNVNLTTAGFGITSAEAHGTTAVTPGAVTINIGTTGFGVATAEAFGTAVVGRGAVTVTPGGVASLEAHGTTTVTPGVRTLTVAGIATAEAHGSTTVTAGAVTVVPGGVATAEAFGSAAVTTGAVTITTAGIATAEAHGAAAVTTGAVTVSPASIDTGETSGQPSLSAILYPAGAATAEAFGDATLTVTVAPTAIATAAAFGDPAVTAGEVSLAPAGVPTAEVFGAATLTTGVVLIVPAGIGTAEDLPGPILTTGVVVLSPTGIASAEDTGTSTITTGAVSISPTAIASAEELGAATVTAGAVTIEPAAIGTSEVFGDAALALTVSAAAITPDETFGTPTLTIAVTAEAINSAETFGAAALSTGPVAVAPSAIDPAEAFGSSTITTGAVTVSPAGVPSSEAFGAPSLDLWLTAAAIEPAETFGTASLTLTIVPAAIATEEAAGAPELTVGAVTISPPSIGSDELVETPDILTGTGTVLADGAESAEAFGTAAISTGVVFVEPAAIDSSAAVGEPAVTAGVVLLFPAAAASQEAFGDPALTAGAVTISPAGIDTAELVGDPLVAAGPVTLTPAAVGSAELFGDPAVTVGGVQIGAPAIATGEAFGDPVLLTGGALIAPAAVDSAENVAAPTITTGAVLITPAGVVSEEATGSPTVAAGGTGLYLDGVASTEAVPAPTVITGPVEITAGAVASQETFGVATLSAGGVVLTPVGADSAETFGAATLSAGAAQLWPAGIESAGVFGAAALALVPFDVWVSPAALPSAEVFGAALLTHVIPPVYVEAEHGRIEVTSAGSGRVTSGAQRSRAVTGQAGHGASSVGVDGAAGRVTGGGDSPGRLVPARR